MGLIDRRRRGDAQTRIFGGAQDLKRIRASHRSRVITAACQRDQPDVAFEHHRFSGLRNAKQPKARGKFAFVHHAVADQIWVFSVMNDHRIEIAGISQRAAHDLCVGHTFRTVGEGNRARRLQQANLGHLFAFKALGDRSHRMHVHDGVIARAAQDVVDGRWIIDSGRCVGLTNNRGDSTGSRCLARGGEGFATSLAGLPNEGAHVDESRGHQFSPAVDHLGPFRYAGGADPFLGLTDGTFGNQEIAENIEVARRIDDPGIG